MSFSNKTIVCAGAGGGGGGGASSGSNNGGFITWTITSGSGGWTVYPAPVVEAKPEAKKKKDKDGCDCKKCKEFYPYAEPNQDDGTLLCYRCRTGW